ncbi:MAG: ATP-binding protein, partial [Calditrichota bacterium]
YVARREGTFEKLVNQAIDARGTICMITGPSKTGKTSLYSYVLKNRDVEPLIVRCTTNTSASSFWKYALESIDFARINQKQAQKSTGGSIETTAEGKLGWKWLASITGKITGKAEASKTETEIREHVLAEPSAEHLIPVLKKLPTILVIEDFHYLKEDIQRVISQQWKMFVDNEISILIVSTTHHSIDLAMANKDLIGRVTQIEVSTWDEDDLAKIAQQGFQHLNISIDVGILSIIARESVGLPIITQQVCRQLLVDFGIAEKLETKRYLPVLDAEVYKALNTVARSAYSQLAPFYEILIRGPRKKARKYDTYELVVATFSLNPIKFSISREEIDDRLRRLPIKKDKLPPTGSINTTLNALAKFQSSKKIELLEWHEITNKLYIIEPSFLFYLRWRETRKTALTALEVLKRLIRAFEEGKSTPRNPA